MLLLKDCSFKYYHIYFSHFKGYYIHYIHYYPVMANDQVI
jgi:hypothetical protein